MKVYIIIDNAPEKHVRQIFTEQSKAKNFVSQDRSLNDGITSCYIEEYYTDIGLTVIPRLIRGEAFIRFIDKWDHVGDTWVKKEAGRVYDSDTSIGRRRLAKPADRYDYIGYHYKNEGVKVFSFESQEHARDIAQKLYEDYLVTREETPPIF